MASVRVDAVTAADLRRYQTIRADAGGEAIVVWDSRRMAAMVSADHPGTLIEELDVAVSALDGPSVEALQRHLASLDTKFGDKRLVAVDPSLLDENRRGTTAVG